jgi:hypothetical protein
VAALAGSDGRVRSLLFDGSPLLASAVFAGPGEAVLVGADAVRAAVGYPEGLEPHPKRRIDDGTVWLGEREYPLVELAAAVLARVAAEATRVIGGAVDEVVLTHPAAWARPRIGLLADAAARAGFAEVRFVAEPVAAAAYFAGAPGRQVPVGRCIVVYDLGAGTFDVSAVRLEPYGFEVVRSAGLPDLGGLDLDAAVVRHARMVTAGAAGAPEAWQRLNWPRQVADRQARHTLWQGARAVKEQLSRHPSGELYVPIVDRPVHLTREEFDLLARPYLDRTGALTRRLLAESGVAPEEIGAVFLVGGSSRVPLVATLLHRMLQIAPTVVDHPELVVAEGALRAPATTSAPITGAGRVEPDGPAPLPVAASSVPSAERPSTTGSDPSANGPTAGSSPLVPSAPVEPSAPIVPVPRSLGSQRPRRLPVVAVVVLVAATLLAAVRPWQIIAGVPGGALRGLAPSSSACAFYERFGDLTGATVTVLSRIDLPTEESRHRSSYEPFEECTGVTIKHAGDGSSFLTRLPEMVRAGNPPDIAYVPQPSNLLRQMVAAGWVKEVPPETAANVDRWFSADWKTYGTVDGRLYAAPVSAQLRSLVWYSPREFRDQGYAVPTTLDELRVLSDKIAAAGRKPWCAGI